jgi:hypothetical protein
MRRAYNAYASCAIFRPPGLPVPPTCYLPDRRELSPCWPPVILLSFCSRRVLGFYRRRLEMKVFPGVKAGAESRASGFFCLLSDEMSAPRPPSNACQGRITPTAHGRFRSPKPCPPGASASSRRRAWLSATPSRYWGPSPPRAERGPRRPGSPRSSRRSRSRRARPHARDSR